VTIKFLDEQEMVCTCFSDAPAVDCPIHGVWLSSGPGEFVFLDPDRKMELRPDGKYHMLPCEPKKS